MFYNRSIAVAVLIAAAASARAQEAPHGDLSPRVTGGRIVVDEHVDGTGLTASDQRVFAYDFQEDPDNPFAIDDPGFNALPGSGLPADSRVGFLPVALPSQLNAVGLAYWNGSDVDAAGDPVFGAGPAGQSLTLNFLSINRTFTAASAPASALFGPGVESNGAFHTHLISLLNGPDGNPDPTDGFAPADGIYVLSFSVISNAGGIDASAPLLMVYNNGLTEEQHDAAIDYAASTVPEPTSLAVLGLGAFGLLRRRRAGV